MVKKLPKFYELEYSLSRSYEPDTGVYREPLESTLLPHILFI